MKKLIERLIDPIVKGRTVKVKKTVTSDIWGRFNYDGIDENTLSSFIEDRDNDNLFSSLEFLDGSKCNTNFFEYLINSSYVPIFKSLFECRANIGTPNAATGEFEIALLVSVSNASKPKSGDFHTPITGVLNFKGKIPRISTEIRGKDLNKVMIPILKKNGINPIIHKKVQYGQLLNKNYLVHFNMQFEKLPRERVLEILFVWLSNLFPEKEISNAEKQEIIEKVTDGNQVIWDKWVKENMIYIYNHSENRNEKYVVFGENGQIFHLTQNIEEFRRLISDGVIEFDVNFFRLNGDLKCAFYLKVNF